MNDYNVSDYGIFSDGVSTINTLNTSISTGVSSLTECKSKLSDGSIFMGPICDSCITGFGNADTKLANISANFSTIASYLTQTSSTYKTGDDAATKTILQIQNGTVVTGTSGNSGAVSGNANQDAIYQFLAKEGFNDAAISGILANIQYESGFNPNALGDGGTSYGICQWHNSRWDRLKNYCSQNGLDSTTLEGQLNYLVWEMKTQYPGIYNDIKNVPNTQQGAYDAAYQMTVRFEVPANKEQSGDKRGNTAVSKYWPIYSNSSSSTIST